MVRMNLLHQSIHQHYRLNPITPIQIQARNIPGAGGLLWPSRSARSVELGDSLSNSRLPPCQTVLFTAGGGTFDSRLPSGERIRGGSLALEPSQKERPTTIPRKRMIEDVPQTALFNGKTLTFGEYRSATLVERASIFLASIGVIGWRASLAFRRSRRTWHRVTVAVLAPCLALLVKSVASYLYREIALQPELLSPENLALPKSCFKDIEGLEVHYLRETPTAVEGTAEVNLTTHPTSVLHLNHGFGASALSWERVIPSLSRALGTVVAHDTPGFGLTARAGIRRTESYSLRFNAGITQRLIRDEVQTLGSSSPPVILIGHSMGCITAVTASLDPSLPPEQTTLVMVSPALSVPSKKTNNNKSGRPGPKEAGVSMDGGVCRTGGRFNTGVSRVLGGLRGLAGALAVPLTSIARFVRGAMVWTFNWCLLPLLYPLEVLLLRSLVYRSDFWRNALRMAWFDETGVDVDVINRYRWPSLVRHWDRGMVLFLLDRLQLGRGGVAGPRGLLDAVAAKAAQGMKVVVIQGENDKLVTLAKAKAIAAAIPDAKLLVVPECGHVPHEEKPQEFLQLLLGQLGHREEQTNKDTTGCAID